MSWASSNFFPLEILRQRLALVRSGPVRVSSTTIVRKPHATFRACFSRLNLFDAMLGRAGYERLTEARTVA